jgi:hypothetical protein
LTNIVKLSLFIIEGTPELFLFCMLAGSRKRFSRRDTDNLFGTGESENLSVTHPGKLLKIEMPGIFRQ